MRADSSLPRVLVLDEEIPWPAHTGKRLRTLNLLTALARDFSLDFATHASGAAPEAIAEMARRGITVLTSNSRVPGKSGPLLPLRVAASITRGLPYSVHSHYQPSLRRMVHDRLRQGVYGMVHCEWTPYAQYLREPDIPICIAAHNVEWLIWQRLMHTETRPAHKLLFDLQARLMRRFESEVFTTYRHVTAVSEGDAAIIRTLGCQDVVVVPNGVDTDAYRPPPEDAGEPRTLVFTGSLDWRANQDAIRWFISDVHPHLRALGPYRLYVVGREPPAWLRDPAIVPGQLVVTGTVDDVRPWIAKAAVYIVPLRAGGGSRLKILEALAMGRAVVSTEVGAEGLDLEPGTHLRIADEPRGFAAAIDALFQDRSRAAALGQAGRERVEARYGWDRIAPIQAALWRRMLSGDRAITGVQERV